MLQLVRCIIHIEAGEPERALAVLGPDPVAYFERIPRDLTWSTALALSADIVPALDLVEVAGRLAEMLRSHPDHIPTTGATVAEVVHYTLGCLVAVTGDTDGAIAHLERAEQIHRTMGARPSLARTHLALAEVLTSRGGPGDAEAARDLARDARTVARVDGYLGVEAHAGLLLERPGRQ